MPKGYTKNGINKGWFKKGHQSETQFKKGNISWNKNKKIWGKDGILKKENPFKNKRHSEETKEINRQKHLGNIHTLKTRKQMSKGKIGHPTTKETKDKIGLANKGEKNGMWLDGKSFEPYGIEFNNKLKNQIRKRDNYICQKCYSTIDKKGCRLSIHHIDYNKQNSKPENLISLCKSCHIQTNFKRKDWTNWFKKKIKNDKN